MTTAERASRAPAVPPDAVRAALACLLASDVVGGSRRTSDFLAYTVGEVLAGRGDRLKERTVATGALGRGPRFDPRTDPCVRVQARRVRAALERYYAGPGAHDPVRIELPRGGYRPAFRPNDALAPPPVAVAPAPPIAVAVAAVVNLTPGGDLDHLAPGLSEALVAAMSRLPGCRVIGPVAPAEWDDLVLLRADRGVRFVLAGTVRSRGSAVRATMRLVDTARGDTRWSMLFDGRVDDDAPFAMEDGIVADVTAALSAHRADAEAPGRGGLDAPGGRAEGLTVGAGHIGFGGPDRVRARPGGEPPPGYAAPP